MRRTLYIISGPAGAGKSTTSKRIAGRLAKSAYIEGDLIDHMVFGGYEMPWLSQYHTDLIWQNILSLANNFIHHDHDVVIDYVAFMHNAEYIASGLEQSGVSVKFAILITDEEELLRRDAERQPQFRMGHRCIEGLKEIRRSNPPEHHIINTTRMDVDSVVEEIMGNPVFLIDS
ncbi:AAA family ATPase [Cohnella luojiensis]|uniref:AAA family ATPase n=1 Tax=Cohnella luojiensis TaxID=652876 RepID=UPI001431AAE0|nr:AAA family ATPase [Cohnella luojiensis]